MVEFFEFLLQTRVLFEPGLVRDIGHEALGMNAHRAFIVGDMRAAETGNIERVREGLATAIEVVGTFADIPQDAEIIAVEQAAARARELGADVIVGVGGGAAIDSAKAVRILVSEGGDLRDYEGANLLKSPLVPMIAIPTTAGTGSEVTSAAMLNDERAGIKRLFVSPTLAPTLAALDPQLTLELAPDITAASGIDALSHAIEAFVGTGNNPITDSLALQAIDMISNNLRAATFSGHDIEARGQMMIAACIAGIAFSSGFQGANAGIVHAAAYTLGAGLRLSHGALVAALLPAAMRFNSVAIPNRFARIARAMGVNAGGRSEDDVVEDGIAAVAALIEECGLATRLRDLNVPEPALTQLAEATIIDGAIFTNPRPVSPQDAADVLRAAW